MEQKHTEKTFQGTSTKTHCVVKYPCDQHRKQNSITCYLCKEAVTQRGSIRIRSWYPKYVKSSYNSMAKNPNNLAKRMGRRPERTFFQGRCTESQLVHKKVLDITIHQRNANPSHSDISYLSE